MAGRPPTIIENPFVHEDETGFLVNELFGDDNLTISLEDILVGCCRALAEQNAKQELVSWSRLLYVYRFVDVITRQSVQEQLGCSEAQAKRYIQAVKLANPFILRHKQKNRSPYRGYIELTNEQVSAGFLML